MPNAALFYQVGISDRSFDNATEFPPRISCYRVSLFACFAILRYLLNYLLEVEQTVLLTIKYY